MSKKKLLIKILDFLTESLNFDGNEALRLKNINFTFKDRDILKNYFLNWYVENQDIYFLLYTENYENRFLIKNTVLDVNVKTVLFSCSNYFFIDNDVYNFPLKFTFLPNGLKTKN